MVPAGLQEKVAAFVERRRPVIADLIKRLIASGRSPEDQLFVIPAEDAASQKVTALMFGLEKEAAAGPLPQGFVIGKADFFATSSGQAFESCEPKIYRFYQQRTYGEAKVLAVVDGYFCGIGMMYRPGSMPAA
ncbi:hypothetical protein A3C96_04365 [Candidatus Uhrbacteria bacterium RIFCSPHIGHO2_02_FULL_60_10]|uniref:Uncharacterized protein n=1 Tax=Candidatus Uhrbacteria bacterium RIFCSPHIGHO2_02_FULL_60_10 TaxID=1802392 RepID=A0A1F7U9E3_9BACT|nr:MAG: hypothetical protein A3C96_04365 [Candidatus Uhrbacteria bacterium RIFCSPHIGHO2_02_FULL_60_10]